MSRLARRLHAAAHALVRRRGAIAALALVQVLLLGVSSVVGATRWLAAPLDDDMYVLLVMGSDQGPPRGGAVTNGRADGFHLLVVAPDHEHVSILSFPRDSWVDVPGIGRTKINASLTLGPENAVATAEHLTGLDVDDWIITGFHGLIAAVDELGGVEVEVQERLYDPSGSSSNLYPGVQTLEGWQALAFARDRHSRRGGDFGRSEAHARFLQAIHAQLFGEAPGPARLAELVSILRRHTVTSMSTARMFRLAALAMRIDPDQLHRRRMPGYATSTSGGASIVRLTDEIYDVFEDVREDGILGHADDAGDTDGVDDPLG